MNLFEAKHILQSVGYTVEKDYAGKACAILESAIRSLPTKMLSEMSKSRADKAKADKVSNWELVARLEQDMAAIDSKKSNFSTGKAKDPGMANAAKFLADYEALAAVDNELDAFGLETLNNFVNDGYYEACQENDAALVKKANKGNGAGEGGNFGAAVENGDVKRALKVLMNRIRSGFNTEEAKQRTLDALDTVAEMEGAEAVMDRIDAAREVLLGKELGAHARRSADSYTVIVPEDARPAVISAYLRKAGIKPEAITLDGNVITFTGPAGAVAKATEILDTKGIEITKNERPATANAGGKTTRTVIVDDIDIAGAGLLDSKCEYEFGDEVEGGCELILTGSAKQIQNTIDSIISVGCSVTEAE